MASEKRLFPVNYKIRNAEEKGRDRLCVDYDSLEYTGHGVVMELKQYLICTQTVCSFLEIKRAQNLCIGA